MRIGIIISLFLFLVAGNLLAQSRIVALNFEGTKKSKEPYLLNFVQSLPGTVGDTALIDQDARNLLNTNLFAIVVTRIDTVPDGVILTYSIKEKISSYPAGNGGIIDDNIWTELGWRDNHFLGRGIRAMLLAKYYDRFAIRGFFQAPYWFGSGWGMESNWEFGRTIEPITINADSVLRFNQDRRFMNLMASYAFKPNNLIYAGIEFESLEYTFRDRNDFPEPAALEEIQTKIQFIVRQHNRFHLNIFEQYVTGWANEFILKTAFVEDRRPNHDNRWYPFFQNELKVFVKPWATGNIGLRNRIGIAENHPSVFAQFIQDSFLNARGIGNKPFRGTAELTTNIELRQTIYDRKWIALQSVAFFDYSAIRPPGGNFNDMFLDENSHSFAGIGGRIFFKNIYDFILRMDVGFSLNDNRRGFVMGLGHYF
jgi:hypothetical protein